jgi:O-methyltransferase involved in polyketide biosynthesis
MLCWVRGSILSRIATHHAASGLRVFEVDHPSTQEWKRSQLETVGIPVPEQTRFIAVNFERQSLEPVEGRQFSRRRALFFLVARSGALSY